LTINAIAGNVDIDAIGAGVVDGIDLVDITGTTIDLGGNIINDGAAQVALTGNVTLSADVTIDTNTVLNDSNMYITAQLMARRILLLMPVQMPGLTAQLV